MATIERLFGRSPFRPLQEHMSIVKKCVDQIIPFFEAEIKGEKNTSKSIAKKIFDLEEKADEIKNALRDHLPRSLFMPVIETIYWKSSMSRTQLPIRHRTSALYFHSGTSLFPNRLLMI